MSDTPITDAMLASIQGGTTICGAESITCEEDYYNKSLSLLRTLERELNNAKKWKEEDPRMLREQMRVHDVSFQNLFDVNKKLEQQLTSSRELNQKMFDVLVKCERDGHQIFCAAGDSVECVCAFIEAKNVLTLARSQGFGKGEV